MDKFTLEFEDLGWLPISHVLSINHSNVSHKKNIIVMLSIDWLMGVPN